MVVNVANIMQTQGMTEGVCPSWDWAVCCCIIVQTVADRVQCAGQVPLNSQEAEALKASRQSSASTDWLMEADLASPSNAADTGMY